MIFASIGAITLNNILNLGTFLPSTDTHQAYILYCLLSGYPLNNKQLFFQLNTCHGASRICELRQLGWSISDRHLAGCTNLRSKEYFISRDTLISYRSHPVVQNFMLHCSGIYDLPNAN